MLRRPLLTGVLAAVGYERLDPDDLLPPDVQSSFHSLVKVLLKRNFRIVFYLLNLWS